MAALTVWKLPFALDAVVRTVEGATVRRILTAGLDPAYGGQPDRLALWVLVEPGVGLRSLIGVRVRGTGHPVDSTWADTYLTTVQAGPLVWHVFAEVVE